MKVSYSIFFQRFKVDYSGQESKSSFGNNKIIFEVLSEQEL